MQEQNENQSKYTKPSFKMMINQGMKEKVQNLNLNESIYDFSNKGIKKSKFPIEKCKVQMRQLGLSDHYLPFYFSSTSFNSIFQLKYYKHLKLEPSLNSHMVHLINYDSHRSLSSLSIKNIHLLEFVSKKMRSDITGKINPGGDPIEAAKALDKKNNKNLHSDYIDRLFEAEVISRKISSTLENELGFYPDMKKLNLNPESSSYSSHKSKLSKLKEFVDKQDRSFNYIKGRLRAFEIKHEIDQGKVVNENEKIQNLFMEGAKYNYSHDCIAEIILSLQIKYYLNLEKKQNKIIEYMTELFLSAFLKNGIITDENSVEDSLGLLKLFYVLLDTMPAFKNHVIKSCIELQGSWLKEKMEIHSIELKLQTLKENDLANKLETENQFSRAKRKARNIEDMYKQTLERKAIDWKISMNKIIQGRTIEKKLVLYILVELNYNCEFFINALHICEYIASKPEYNLFNLFLGDLYSQYFLGLCKIDVEKRIKCYNKIVKDIDSKYLSVSNAHTGFESTYREGKMTSKEIIEQRSLERLMVIYKKLFNIAKQQEYKKINDYTSSEELRIKNKKLLEINKEMVVLYQKAYLFSDKLKRFTSEKAFYSFNVFKYQHNLYCYEFLVKNDVYSQIRESDDPNQLIIQAREVYIEQSIKIAKYINLLGFTGQLLVLFWASKMLKKSIKAHHVDDLKKSEYFFEYSICIRNGLGINKSLKNAMFNFQILIKQYIEKEDYLGMIKCSIQISKIFEETSDAKESIDINIVAFVSIYNYNSQLSTISKEMVFVLGIWSLRMSSTFKNLFVIGVEFLKIALKITPNSDYEVLIHYKIERELLRVSKKYSMLTTSSDKNDIKIQISKYAKWGFLQDRFKYDKDVRNLIKRVHSIIKPSIKKDKLTTKEKILKLGETWFKLQNEEEFLEGKKNDLEDLRLRALKKSNNQKSEREFVQIINRNKDIRRIKPNQVEIKEEKQFEFFEGVTIGVCQFLKCKQFLRFFRVRVKEEEHMKSILENIKYLELYHPFLVNYYGVDIKLQEVKNYTNVKKQKVSSQTAYTPKSSKKQAPQLEEYEIEEEIEIMFYCDYFSDIIFSRVPNKPGEPQSIIEKSKIWLRGSKRPDQMIRLMYQLICGLYSFHGVGKPFSLFNPYHIALTKKNTPKLIVPFFTKYFGSGINFLARLDEGVSSKEIFQYYSPEFHTELSRQKNESNIDNEDKKNQQLNKQAIENKKRNKFQEILLDSIKSSDSKSIKEGDFDLLKNDIWGLGIFFLQIMSSDDFLTENELNRFSSDFFKDKRQLVHNIKHHISKINVVWADLIKLIHKMLSFKPEERPNMFTIKQTFEKLCFKEVFTFSSLNRSMIQRHMFKTVVLSKDNRLEAISEIDKGILKVKSFILPKNTMYKGEMLKSLPHGEGKVYKEKKLILEGTFKEGIINDKMDLHLDDGSTVEFILDNTYPSSCKITREIDETILKAEISKFELRTWIPETDQIYKKVKDTINIMKQNGKKTIKTEDQIHLYLDFINSSFYDRFNLTKQQELPESCYTSFYDAFGVIFKFNTKIFIEEENKNTGVLMKGYHKFMNKKEKRSKMEVFKEIDYDKAFTMQFTELDKIHKHVAYDKNKCPKHIFISKINLVSIISLEKQSTSFKDIYSILMASEPRKCEIVDFMGNTFSGEVERGKIDKGTLNLANGTTIELNKGKDDYFHGDIISIKSHYKGELMGLKRNGHGAIFEFRGEESIDNQRCRDQGIEISEEEMDDSNSEDGALAIRLDKVHKPRKQTVERDSPLQSSRRRAPMNYIFEGCFEDNLPSGIGMLLHPEYKSIIFKGIFKRGVPLYGSFFEGPKVFEGYLYYKNKKTYGDINMDTFYEINKQITNFVFLGLQRNKKSGTSILSLFSDVGQFGNEYMSNMNKNSIRIAKIFYNNGDVYIGMVFNQICMGKGIIIKKNGDTYSGVWEDDKLVGKFESGCKDINASILKNITQNYQKGMADLMLTQRSNSESKMFNQKRIAARGVFNYNKKLNTMHQNEFGMVILRDGTIYTGNMSNNLYHGIGKIVYPNKTSYSGHFEEGIYKGYGILSEPSTGVIIKGEFDDAKAEGCCTLTVHGKRYCGYFERGVLMHIYYNSNFIEQHFNDEINTIAGLKVKEMFSGAYFVEHRTDYDFNGFVKAVLKNNIRYEGQSFYNSISGYGKLYRRISKGNYHHFYEGEFRNQVFEGLGKKNIKKGEIVYQGQFQSGLEHGYGIVLKKNGVKILSRFDQGKMVGISIVLMEDKIVQISEKAEGVRHGVCLEYGENSSGVDTSRLIEGRMADKISVYDKGFLEILNEIGDKNIGINH